MDRILLEQMLNNLGRHDSAAPRIGRAVAPIFDQRAIGHSHLPVELLALVGSFLAGSNNYASLANYSLTCHAMYYELQPILFETVVVSETDRKWREKVSDDHSLKRWFGYTRFLITENSTWDRWNHEMFPNLAIVIHKKPMTPIEEAQQLRYATIEIHHSVHLETLTELLRIPVFWKPHRYHYTSRWPTGRVKSIKINPEAFIDGHVTLDSMTEVLSTARYSGIDVDVDIKHRYATEQLGWTISNALWVTMWVESLRMVDEGNVRNEIRMATFGFYTNGGLPVAKLAIEAAEEMFDHAFFSNISIDLRKKKVSTDDLEELMISTAQDITRWYRRLVRGGAADDDFWLYPFLTVRCGGKVQGGTIGRLMPLTLERFRMQSSYIEDVFEGEELEEVCRTEVFTVSGNGNGRSLVER